MTSKNIEEAICKICKKKFLRRNKKRCGKITNPKVRGTNCVTCSRECSRINTNDSLYPRRKKVTIKK